MPEINYTDKKIRVVHYIWSANFGGIEKLVIDLSKIQILTGNVKPFILIGCKKGSFIEKLKEMNMPHDYIGMKNGSDLSPITKSKTSEIFAAADIIHIHTFNPIIFEAAKRSGKKIMYTVHGNFFFGRKMKISDHIHKFLARILIPRYTDFITYNSKFSEIMSDKLFKTGSINGAIIPNGIFLDDIFKTNQSEIDKVHLDSVKGKFVVGTSSRFVGVKRIDRIIDAFAEFSKSKTDVVLLLVGDGLMRNQIEEWVDKAGIRQKTIFTGFQSKVRNYQDLMDICVFASQNEAFGLVAIETLSLGKPTLMFKDAGGMLEIIENSFSEDIVTDIPQLVQRMEYYYQIQENSSELLNKKRQAVASGYNIKITEKLFYDAYLKLLNF